MNESGYICSECSRFVVNGQAHVCPTEGVSAMNQTRKLDWYRCVRCGFRIQSGTEHHCLGPDYGINTIQVTSPSEEVRLLQEIIALLKAIEAKLP